MLYVIVFLTYSHICIQHMSFIHIIPYTGGVRDGERGSNHIKPNSNSVFLTYLHTTYVSFIHIQVEFAMEKGDFSTKSLRAG
jgi:hypothetical protein